MKYIIYIAFTGVFFVLTGNVAQAQTYLGVKGGVNLSTMQFTNNYSYRLKEIDMIRGYTGGVVFQYIPQPHTGMQLEVNYSERGWRDSDDSLEYTRHINYLEVPFLSHFYLGNSNFRIVIDLGMYGAYAFSSDDSQKVYETGEEISGDYEFVEGSDNVWDYGIMGGGGFEYLIGNMMISANARYTYGLGNIFAEKEILASEISQNRVITISFGLLYKIGAGKNSQ